MGGGFFMEFVEDKRGLLVGLRGMCEKFDGG